MSHQDFKTTAVHDWARSLDQYHNSFLHTQDAFLAAALRHSTVNGLPKACQKSPRRASSSISSIGANRVIEVGTLGGYSTIWLARALPADGQLITLELSERHAKVARGNINRARLSTKLYPEFDLVFMDADKQGSKDYFREAKRLVRKGGIIIVDNAVRYGGVADLEYSDPQVEGVRALLHAIKGDAEVDATTMGTVGDKGYNGFLYVIRK